ncbi:MAG: TRAP transporter small permease [Oscillospiraceae bacterium]|nr:TRAP transporter small permease [Oscillospiraceae bacterium]MBR6208523.1 TRAP transporter small permease [Oscillospiraceae bacterium]
MKKVLAFLDENLEEYIMAFLLGVISIVMMSQVIARYVFHHGFTWAEEVCRYCFVYSGLLSAGYCARKGISLRVDAIFNFFPKPVQIIIDLLSKLLIIFLYGFFFVKSFGLIATTNNFSTAMQLPMKYVYAAIPLGMGLGVIRCVQDLIKFCAANFGKKKEEAK